MIAALNEISSNDNIERAESLIISEDYPEAASILLTILDEDPKNCKAYNNLGIISWNQKNWSDAHSLFKHAVDCDNTNGDAIVNLFDASLKLHKIEDDKEIFLNAPNTVDNDDEVNEIAKGIIDEGDDIYFCMRALAEGAYYPEIEEANALVQDEKLNEAMLMFLDFIESNGPTAEAFNGLGVISYYQDRHEDAFTMFFESLKLNPINRDTFLNFFDVAKICNKLDKAFEIFKVYRETYPHLELLEKEVEAYRE
jgi:tetratricopeptide (TPR) repeat protein